MTSEVKVPGFPESITDGIVVAWHKRPGDAVRRDENLVDIETDKVMFEVPAPADGYLEQILQPEGATVTAGQVLAHIGEAPAGAAKPSPAPAAKGNGDIAAAPKIVMPAARRLIEQHGLDADSVSASGKGGRVLKEDVLRALEGPNGAQAAAATPSSGIPAPARAAAPEPVPPAIGGPP